MLWQLQGMFVTKLYTDICIQIIDSITSDGRLRPDDN